MKLIHLSDLHIGRRVNEFSMIEDQKYILDQILFLVEKEQADGVILAGDIYDKPVPTAEAVQVLDEFLTKLANWNIVVFVISGNHDSPERIGFGARLMRNRGVYFSSVYEGVVEPICLQDSYGEICFYLLPFIKPATVRHIFPEEEIKNYQEAVKTAIDHMTVEREKRNILVCHQFVTGASLCESEEIEVGGLEHVDASLFDSFDYVALGHIHSPQHIRRKTIRYCGTPLKYSFSEANQEKSITVIQLKEKGNVEIHTAPLAPLRDMRQIRGAYLEITNQSFYKESNTEDYIQAVLTDEEDIPDVFQRLRVIYPNLMRLEYDNKRTKESRLVEGAEAVEKKSEIELFEEFYQLQNNQPMTQQQKEFVQELLREITPSHH